MDEGRVWDRFAPRYELIARVFGASYPAVRRELAFDLGTLGERPKVLELAAGTGQFTAALAEASGTLIATDLSEAMLERLAERLKGEGIEWVQLQTMSAYAIEAEDQSFDVVFAANLLHVLEDHRRALREIRRVLRPGGLLIAPTFCHGIDRGRRALSRAMSLVSPFVAHTRFTPQLLYGAIEAGGLVVLRHAVFPGLIPVAYVVAERRA